MVILNDLLRREEETNTACYLVFICPKHLVLAYM